MKKKSLLFIAAICFIFSLRVITADAAEITDAADSIPVESMTLDTANTLTTNGNVSTIDEDEPIILDEAVVLTAIDYTSAGVTLEWEAFPKQKNLELLGYIVYRLEFDFKTMDFIDEGEVFLTEANELTLLDDSVEPRNIYSYTVAAVLGKGEEATHLSNLGEESQTCLGYAYTLETPELVLINYADSINLSWDEVPYADGYEILKRTANGEWSTTPFKKITGGDTTSYNDSSVVNGTGYYYCIRPYFNDPAGNNYYWSASYSDSVYIKRLAKPVLNVANASNGVKLSWKAIDGAKGYIIFRDGAQLDTTESLSYIDKTVETNTEYKYTVAAYYQGSKSLCYSTDSDAKTITYVPVESDASSIKLSNYQTSIKVSWSKVDGASGYYIYRRTASGNWSTKPYATISGGSTVSYKDTSVTKGTGYYYKVSSYKTKNGKKVEGDCSDPEYIKRLSRPTLTASYGASCIKLSWKKISGATGYVVYRDGIEIGTTENSYYNDYEIENGDTYNYTLKAYYQASSQKIYSSTSANATIKGLILIVDAPEIKVLNYVNDIYISWDKVSGASGYRIYRRTASGNWSGTPYATVTSGSITSYRDKSFTKGTGYYYKVTAYKTKSGSTVESEFSNTEYIKRMSRPSVTVTNKEESLSGDSYVELTWKKVSGADGYAVYRGDTLVETTEDASYKDYNVSNGKKYQYKVRAYYKGSSKKYYSAYSAVDTIYHMPAPSSFSISAGSKKFTVKCSKNSSATGTQVIYSTSPNMTNAKSVKFTGTSKTVTGLSANKLYYVRVRHYKTVNGVTYYGAYSLVSGTTTKR